MERESFTLESKDVQQVLYDDLEGYTLIESTTDYTDLEKGYQEVTIVIQRESDKKYFISTDSILDSQYESPEDTEFEEVNKVIKLIETEVWE